MNEIFRLVEPWTMDADSDDLIQLRDHLVWLQKELFHEYEPNRYESFDDRVSAWLRNVPDGDDRKSLFRLLEHLFFVGKQQFDSLCRAAYGAQTTRWLIDLECLSLTNPQLSQLIDKEMRNTWFCPITDSMRINSFLKLNGHPGHDYRPDWRSLQIFADPDKLRNYVLADNIKRLVLLEDFVGSGNQIKEVVGWAAATLPRIPILVIPLVCCPAGVKTGKELSSSHGNVIFSPTLTLRPEHFLIETPRANEPEVFAQVRNLIHRVGARLNGWESNLFGYETTGALVALYSNCPDNTLPIVHYKGADWNPLFPRVRRS
ncbi:MAG TPA: hypothetical protein PLK13_02365 [Xanthobacteraceae bacterium]|jgi:hypothetical protein|nr:hypothetical protein [Xanthobacteraceae bacterium]HQS46381.1 hypothetical protein [Xanthobacteraceae bacterium]